MANEELNQIRSAQIAAGEIIVMRSLVKKGLMGIDEFEKTTGEKYNPYQQK